MVCKHVGDLKADWSCQSDRNRMQPFTTSECEKTKVSKLNIKRKELSHWGSLTRENIGFKMSVTSSLTFKFSFYLMPIWNIRIRICHLPKKKNESHIWIFDAIVKSLSQIDFCCYGDYYTLRKSSNSTSSLWIQLNERQNSFFFLQSAKENAVNLAEKEC